MNDKTRKTDSPDHERLIQEMTEMLAEIERQNIGLRDATERMKQDADRSNAEFKEKMKELKTLIEEFLKRHKP